MSGGISGQLWFIIDVLFVVALAGALIYGMVRWRQWRNHPTAAAEREAKTRELFKEGSRGE
jgi:hypothetical protein